MNNEQIKLKIQKCLADNKYAYPYAQTADKKDWLHIKLVHSENAANAILKVFEEYVQPKHLDVNKLDDYKEGTIAHSPSWGSVRIKINDEWVSYIKAEKSKEDGDNHHNLDVLHLGCCTKCGLNKFLPADCKKETNKIT